MWSQVVICSVCKKQFTRINRQYNEAKKFGWQCYCSLACLRDGKTLSRAINCSNPQCLNIVSCTPARLKQSVNIFCSSSCAAIFNNSIRPRKYAPKICLATYCENVITGPEKYCSRKCANSSRGKTLETVRMETIRTIQEFYKTTGRIPLKQEMWGIYKPSRRAFGSWNKAIEAAGFTPNPVMFADRHQAHDGHMCDSLSEKIIDDWLYQNHIVHKIHVPYPTFPAFTCDFVVGEYFIEFFGLDGVHEKYTKLAQRKRLLAKTQNIQFIELTPKHLFPKSQLHKKLNFLLKIAKNRRGAVIKI